MSPPLRGRPRVLSLKWLLSLSLLSVLSPAFVAVGSCVRERCQLQQLLENGILGLDLDVLFSRLLCSYIQRTPPFPRLCSSSSCPSSPLSLVSVKFLRGYQITEQSEHGLASVWSSDPLLIVARSSPSMPGRPPELHLS